MASEIHRRRTGRGLKVSEEIVVKEEMYEEEDDDLPRHYKYLTAHLKTDSSDMNSRVNAYITTHAAMATMARYNEVNRLFSESFPTAMAQQQQLSTSMYMQPLTNMSPFAQPAAAPGSPTAASPSQSRPTLSRREGGSKARRASSAVSPTTTSASVASPPALTPASHASASEATLTPDHASAFPALNLDPQLTQQSSSFTSELPNEIKMMAGIDMNDPMATHFFGGDTSAWSMFGQEGNSNATSKHQDINLDNLDMSSSDIVSPIEDAAGQLNMSLESYSGFGTPCAGDSWEAFVDFGSEQ
jgi:hypothetical protein